MWTIIAWADRWRIAAPLPLVILAVVLIQSLIAFKQGSNLWPIVVILFAPLGFICLAIVALARVVANRRAAP